MMLEYNSPTSLRHQHSEADGHNPEKNLRYCPKCEMIYERRYDPNEKMTIVYRYSLLWMRLGSSYQVVPNKRFEECKAIDCSGDVYVLNY